MMAAGAGALVWPAGMAYGQSGEKVLRIGMTLSDIPVTTGQASGRGGGRAGSSIAPSMTRC